jgi:hypothetical protein
VLTERVDPSAITPLTVGATVFDNVRAGTWEVVNVIAVDLYGVPETVLFPNICARMYFEDSETLSV